jgi:hypothetical protein
MGQVQLAALWGVVVVMASAWLIVLLHAGMAGR